MSAVDDLQKWVALGGAVMATVAAVVSTVHLWRSLSANADKIKVAFGSLEPPMEPGDGLYVISGSDHRVVLRDYGFIGEDGQLLSLPDVFANEPGGRGRIVTRGSSALEKRGDLFEIGNVEIRERQIGSYAVTAGQERLTTAFGRDVPPIQRWWLKLKIWWKL